MEARTGPWRAPLALLLGVAVVALPDATLSAALFFHMQRLALPAQAVALLYPPFNVGLLLAALPAASLAGRLGPRRAFLASVGSVAVLSIGTVLPLEQWGLMGLRLFQGMASAGVFVAALGLVRPVFGEARLGPGFGAVVVAGILGTTLLPALAGFGAAFGAVGAVVPGLVLAAAALLLGRRTLPAGAATGSFDGAGALLNLACLGLLLAALYTAPFRPFRGFVLAVLGLLVLVLWLWWGRRRAHSLLPLGLLSRARSGRATLAALLGGLAIAAVGTTLTSHLLVGWAVRPGLLNGLLLIAAATAAGAAAACGWLVRRRPGWRPAAAGALLLAAGAVALVLPWGGTAMALLAVLAFGAGRGLFAAGNALALVGQAPPGQAVDAAGLLVAAGALGGVLAPFLALLSFWFGGAMADGGAAPTYGLGLAALSALLAAMLSAGRQGPGRGSR